MDDRNDRTGRAVSAAHAAPHLSLRGIGRRAALRSIMGVCSAAALTQAGVTRALAAANGITVTSSSMQTFYGFGLAPAAWGAQWYFADSSFTSASVKTSLYNALFTDLKLSFIRWEVRPTFKLTEGAAYDITTATVTSLQDDPTRAARSRISGLKIMYSVWSPPAWMKQNNSLVGNRESDDVYSYTLNRLKYDKRDAFGVYLAEFAKQYKAKYGWPIDYISPQNEPNLDLLYDSCMYTPDEYVQMVKAVDAKFANYGNAETKIMGPELSWPGGDYTEYVNNNAGRSLDLLCMHGYGNAWNDDLGDVPYSARTSKPFFQTEFNYNWNVVDTPEQSGHLGNTFCGDVNNGNAGAWFFWQGVQEPDSNPGEGLILATGSYKTNPVTKISGFTRTRRYYAFQSLTQTVRPGAIARWVNVGSYLDGGNGNVKACALKNSNGKWAIIIGNRTGNTYNSMSIMVDELASSGTVNFTAHATDAEQSNNTWGYSLTNGYGLINLKPYQVIALAQN
jgi:O-glycosyl hydrolase